MANITTKAEMRRYIMYQLGYPVITPEIDAAVNGQLDYIIDDTIDIFRRYNVSEGTYLTYTSFRISACVSEYSLAGYNIENIYDMELSSGLHGINVMFSPEHILLYDQWVNKGNYPGGPGSTGGVGSIGLQLTEYQIMMQYLAQVKVMFGRNYKAKWHKGREIIEINPVPRECGIAMLAVYKNEEAEYLYNNILVKQMCVAKAMKQWGLHKEKYSAVLPDGITITQGMYDRAVQEIKEIEEKMILEGEPPDPMFG